MNEPSSRVGIDRREWSATLLVAAVATLVYAAGIPFGIPALKTVVGADRILAGELPYRDFWTMYAPGSSYAIAAIFALFGRELWIQSLATALLLGTSTAIFFRIQRIQGLGLRPSLAISALFAAMFWSPAQELWSYPGALPFFLATVFLILRYVRGEGRAGLLRAGLLLGVAACFKHDVAAYVAIGLTTALWLNWIFTKSDQRPASWMHPLHATLRIAAGSLVIAGPVIAWLTWKAGADAWDDLIRFPATLFPLVRSDPYPPWIPDLAPLGDWFRQPTRLRQNLGRMLGIATWIQCILPHAFFWSTAAIALLGHVRLRTATLASMLSWSALILPFWWAAHVQQNTHVWSIGIACLSLWGLAWVGAERRSKITRAALALGLLFYAAGHLQRPAMSLVGLIQRWPDNVRLGLPGTSGALLPAGGAAELLAITRFVTENVPPGEPIHVGVVRNDAVVICDQRIYYLGDRPPATRYNELHPAITDRADVQREMIGDLETKRVRCLVLWEFGWSDAILDRIREERVALIPELGSTLLDDYVREHYELVARHGRYLLLWRRGVPLPTGGG